MKYIVLELKITATENIDIDELKELLLLNSTNLKCEGQIFHIDQLIGEIRQSKAAIYPRDCCL